MRFAGTTIGLMALVWGFAQAPFDHVHAGDLDHSAIPGVFHLHSNSESLPNSGLSLRAATADDDEIDVTWSVATPRLQSELHALPVCGPVEWARPALPFAGRVTPPPHFGHDPPGDRSPSSPRSPPVA